jgi:hypothetical protein
MTRHPACCPDPDGCTRNYRDHLVGFGLTAAAIPSRAVNRTPGAPDEPAIRTRRRERQLVRDRDAYKVLRQQGYHPRSVRGAHELAQTATSDGQIEGRLV